MSYSLGLPRFEPVTGRLEHLWAVGVFDRAPAVLSRLNYAAVASCGFAVAAFRGMTVRLAALLSGSRGPAAAFGALRSASVPLGTPACLAIRSWASSKAAIWRAC